MSIHLSRREFARWAAVAGAVWRGGRRDGKIDSVLELLTKITGDHEDRIRMLEEIRRGHR